MRERRKVRRLASAGVIALLAWNCGGTTTSVVGPTPVDTRCTVTLAGGGSPIAASGAPGSLIVSTARECTWSASTEAEWISIESGLSGQGDGRIHYIVATNPTANTRRGAVVVGDASVEIVQMGAACDFALESSRGTVGPAGGEATVIVHAIEGCAWTATSHDEWIVVTGGASSDGDGTVTLSVTPNAGPPRTGSVTIADQPYTIDQGAACAPADLSGTASHADPGGAALSVQVATDPWCTWVATSHAEWIAITSGAQGTGAGTVGLAVAANAGPPRSGSVTIAGLSYTVTQDGMCTYALSHASQRVGLTGGSFAVDVITQPWCEWQARSNDSWIRITSGETGMGGGTVAYHVAARFLPVARTGTLTIAGERLTVRQALF